MTRREAGQTFHRVADEGSVAQSAGSRVSQTLARPGIAVDVQSPPRGLVARAGNRVSLSENRPGPGGSAPFRLIHVCLVRANSSLQQEAAGEANRTGSTSSRRTPVARRAAISRSLTGLKGLTRRAALPTTTRASSDCV